MNDLLEEFIRHNRDKFDNKMPRLDAWASIEQKLAEQPVKKRVFSLWKASKIAAGVLFLLSVGAFSGIYFTTNAYAEATGLSAVSDEMADLELYYLDELDRQEAQFAGLKNTDPTVGADLDQLEAVMADLRKEMAKYPNRNNEAIINAMIKNYQTRIEILEKVMARMQSSGVKNIKKEENEHNIDI